MGTLEVAEGLADLKKLEEEKKLQNSRD